VKKTVEKIEMLLGMKTLRDPKHIVLDGVPIPLRRREGGGVNVACCKVQKYKNIVRIRQ